MEDHAVEPAAGALEGWLATQTLNDLIVAHDNPVLLGVEVQQAL